MGRGDAPPAEGVLAAAAYQSPASSGVKWHLAEVRIEGSGVSTVGFSEPCTVCGRKKRRALQPPTRQRKKVFVIEQEEVCGDDVSTGNGRHDIRRNGSVIEDDNKGGRSPERSVVGKASAGVPASPLSKKEVVGVAHPSTLAEKEKDKNPNSASAKPKKAEGMAAPGGTKKPEALTRDEGTEKVTVRVNETGGVVLSGGKLQQVKLCATCKCQALYEIVF